VNLDELILRSVYASGGALGQYVMLGATALGSGWTAALAAPLLLVPKTRRYAWEFAVVIVTTSLLVFVLKLTIARVRPCYALPDIQAIYILVRPPRDASCPSGHAAGAFSVATYLAKRFGRHVGKQACAALFAIATLIAFSRVYLGVHYPSDIALGALLGACIAHTFTRVWQRGQLNRSY
jgi:undecaprenyl-diphosphatase